MTSPAGDLPYPLSPFPDPRRIPTSAPSSAVSYRIDCTACVDRREYQQALLDRLQLPVRFLPDGVRLEAASQPFVDHAYSKQAEESNQEVSPRRQMLFPLGVAVGRPNASFFSYFD